VKAICGLGNPGPEYDATRHNVGWWLVDRLSSDWDLGSFERSGPALTSRGVVGEEVVLLLKPLTFMNRSGAALAPLRAVEGLQIPRDLLVVVDDMALEVGRARFRPGGSAGGHNGLKSVESALGTREYPRLRIGVGAPPPGQDAADWVLSGFEPGDEDVVVGLLPELSEGVRVWMAEGIEAAMSRYNR
jgi:PTH1 family peptidyl-tRNA hydrolase